MNLLGAKLYDPGTAVSKSTTAALAMTALDTTNLRLAITVPAHGRVRFRLGGTLHGATTFPQIMLGVMNGSTVLGRQAPMTGGGNLAATTIQRVEADFVVTGLTPGAMNCDAAYGVETLVASTGLKYGGPNNTTANDNWGGFMFEAWDPQPQTANSTLAVDSNGRVDVSKVAGTTQTARDLGAQLDATVSSRMATYTQPTGFLAATFPSGTIANTTNITAGTITTTTNLTNLPAITANWITAAGIAAGALNGKGDWNIGKTGYSLTTAPLDAAGTRAAVGLASANLDTQLATLDMDVLSRLATSGYTAPDNTSITAIKAKTDKLVFTVAGYLDANVLKINGVTIVGDGSATPFNV